MISTAGAIAGGGGTGILNVTVPAGYRQTFSKIIALSPVSCIQHFYLQIDAVTLAYQYYDMSGELSYSSEDAPTLPAGHVFTVIIVNNDANAQLIRIILSGLYEEA